MVTRVVTIDILADRLGSGRITTSIIHNGNALVVSLERRLAEVSHTSSPLNSAFGSIRTSCTPCAELDLHGSLGEAGSALGVFIRQGAHDLVVDDPVDGCGCPFDGVDVELADGVGDGMESSTVVCAHVAFAEVVGLDLGVITS